MRPERVEAIEALETAGALAPGARWPRAALARAWRDLAERERAARALLPLADPALAALVAPPVIAGAVALAVAREAPEARAAAREARIRARIEALAARYERARERAARDAERALAEAFEALERGNGRARERTVSRGAIMDAARGLASEPAGATRSLDGGSVGRSYLRSWGASTTLARLERTPDGVRVTVTRERLSRYHRGETYGAPLAAEERVIPLALLASPPALPSPPADPVGRAVLRARVALRGPLACPVARAAVRASSGWTTRLRWRVPGRARRLRAALRRAARS